MATCNRCGNPLGTVQSVDKNGKPIGPVQTVPCQLCR